MQKFTPNDLVRFIYKETSSAEMLMIMDALAEDDTLASCYESLAEGFQQLPRPQLTPSTKTIDSILHYSRQTSFETHL